MIQVNQLTKIYKESTNKAVDDISFALDSGKIGALIGTSGCGKTTTLKMINRLVEPTSGEVIVGGKSYTELDEIQWRRQIGYVVQKGGLLPHLTVEENICLLPKVLKRSKPQTKERVKNLLKLVGLEPNTYMNRYPKQLSGGQQQRVSIARALVEDPPVMLMDEPFGALDPITRTHLHDEFMRLNSELKKTILIVTHDLSEAFKLSDQVMLMKSGKIIQSGSQEDFFNQPKNQFVKDFMDEHKS